MRARPRNHRRSTPRGMCSAIAALALQSSGAAAQDATAEAARRELISQAERASDDGEHVRALDLLTRASQVRMSPSLRQFLAEEYAVTGDWIHAYVFAVQCQQEVAVAEHISHRRDIVRGCQRVESDSRPHLGQLVVHAAADVESLRVSVGGTDVPRALWGVRYPVAAGANVVEALTVDGRTFREEVTIPAGQERVVNVVLSSAPAVTVPPAPAETTPPTPTIVQMTPEVVPRVEPPAPRRLPAVDPGSGGALRGATWSAFGIGLAGIATGVVTTVIALSRAEDFNAMTSCGVDDPNRGGSNCIDAYDRVTSMQTAAVVSWIVGGLGVSAGIAMLALAPSPHPPRRAQNSWWLSGGPGDVGVQFCMAY